MDVLGSIPRGERGPAPLVCAGTFPPVWDWKLGGREVSIATLGDWGWVITVGEYLLPQVAQQD